MARKIIPSDLNGDNIDDVVFIQHGQDFKPWKPQPNIVLLSEKNTYKKGNISLGVGKNCLIKKAIIDKNVRIGDNVIITPENKSSNLISEKFCIQDGIIVIPKNTIIESDTVI